MILLDTNIVSEPWKPRPDPQIVAWIDAQAVETLFLSRDAAPFQAAGVPIINPWAPST
jgi:hypothetical protein